MDDTTTYQQPSLPPGEHPRAERPRPAGGNGGDRGGAGAPPAVVPPRALRGRQRRPAVILLAIALIAAGALGGAVLYQKTGRRVSVLALARDVPFGQRLSNADLKEAQISLDPALDPVSAGSWDKALKMRATTDLKKGAILTKSMLTHKPVLRPGQQVLPVAAKRAQLPAGPLAPGQKVIIESTPTGSDGGNGGNGGSGGGSGSGTSYPATVVRVGDRDTDGTTVVDVAIDPSATDEVAPVISSGKFLVVIAAAGGGAEKR